MQVLHGKINKKAFNLRYFPYICIYFAIFVDMVNGFIQNSLLLPSPVGQLFRGLIIIYTFPYILKQKNTIFGQLAIIVIVLYLFSVPVWLMNERDFSIGVDLVYMTRIVFYYCIVSYFWYYRDQFDLQYLAKLTNHTALISALSLIFCLITNLGTPTYETEGISVGTRGFFTAGNDAGLFMNICLIASIANLLFFNSFKQLFLILIIYIGNIVIASRVGLGGSTLIIVTFVLFLFSKKLRFLKVRKIVLCFIKIIFIIFFISIFTYMLQFINDNPYLLERFTSDNATNPREMLMSAASESINEFSFPQNLIGRSYTGSMLAISRIAGVFDGVPKAAEAEVHDTISAYGYLLGSLILISFFIPLIYSALLYYKKQSFSRFWALLSAILFWGIAIKAGHAFTNAMIFPTLCVLYIIALRFNKDESEKSSEYRSGLSLS